MKRLTQEDFVNRARKVHGNKYDYSKVKYVNSTTKVVITCPIHGDFEQTPANHMRGQGCLCCGNIKNSQRQFGNARFDTRKMRYGVGFLDYDGSLKRDKSKLAWCNMMGRCYNEKTKDKFPTYFGICTVCDNWLTFSNFKSWYDKNYIEGYVLDKDILIKGNKVYSPDTCCFVPQEINKMLTKGDAIRGDLPIGVCHSGGNYLARITINKKYINIGVFNNPISAFNAYKQAKEKHIKQVAQQYFDDGKITEKVYNALMNYHIEITD